MRGTASEGLHTEDLQRVLEQLCVQWEHEGLEHERDGT